jgi:ribosomal protein S18 acetylase RimI-like enzyme
MAGPYLLEPRLLDEAQLEWIQRFSAGEEWWAQEVTSFLHNDALWLGLEGLTTTTLFSLPDAREIVGFVSSASASLPIADMSELVNLPPDTPPRIPAVLIPYMGVAKEHRRSPAHFGREIHLQLLDSVESSWPAVRLMYLECWEENRDGLEFWRRQGYAHLRTKPATRPDGIKLPLVRLFYDRLLKP